MFSKEEWRIATPGRNEASQMVKSKSLKPWEGVFVEHYELIPQESANEEILQKADNSDALMH